MTLIVMIKADLSWTLHVYHNHLRHLCSIVFVVYFFASYLSAQPHHLKISQALRYPLTFSEDDRWH